ncbi:MAG TPA: hypothetical protein VH988_24520 [Thermoanaerobaculia bacterium]|nr:hypothetical protein [Thermoanaerobaculia bacterium]
MSRFRPAIALAILLTFLALPASAVTSSRTNQNRAGGFFSALWNAITSLVSTDGRCGLDPWGVCVPGDTPSQRATIDPAG